MINLNELFNKPRFSKSYIHGENNTRGLYDLVQKYLTKETVMVEIGSFSGVSSELFALHVSYLTCVDPWAPYAEIAYECVIEAEKEFDSMLSNYNNITKKKKTSSEAVLDFEDESLDFVYIDGAHDYTNVINDINSWLPKIKKSGYIGGHDININAIHQAIINSNLTIIETFPEQSWICKVQ